MFINNYETPFPFQSTNDNSSYLGIESQYLKKERARINNIHNENFDLSFKENLFIEKNPQINFLVNIKVTNDEYELCKKESEKIANNLNNKILLNICSVDRLLNIQKHLMELFNYIVFLDQNLDWNHFRNRIDILYLKEKMLNIKYDEINIKQINFYLNRFAPMMNFPRFIPYSTGMNTLYKWVKCQINILSYMYNNKIIEKKDNNNNNEEDVNNSDNINDNNKKLSKSMAIKNSFNDMYIENNKNYNINYNSFDNTNNITNNQTTNNNNITSDYNNINNFISNNNILITNLTYKNDKKKNKKKANKQTNFNHLYDSKNINNNNESKPVIKNTILRLNGYNAIADKFYKEQKVLEHLPLINHRTFQQMRKYYNLINKKNDYKIYNMHRQQILNNSLTGMKNKNKAISLISNNKISIVSELPEERFKDLFDDN